VDAITKIRDIEVSAADLLDGARAISANQVSTCPLNQHWTKPHTFLEWARHGLSDGDSYGFENAITYSKRAACCRIDRLICNYHLKRLIRANFPAKIDALNGIGIDIPGVIHELIILPRNELEHGYEPASSEKARHAMEIAALFLAATDSVDAQDSIIALNMNVQYSYRINADQRRVTFNGWCEHPMLFIDIFDEPNTAKIVDGKNEEALYTELAEFTQAEAIQLASILHSANGGYMGTTAFFFTEIKRLGGF
jgi:hypothetical protein